MAQKWYKNSTVQAAIVVGVFGVIAAIVTGGFSLLKEPLPNDIKGNLINSEILENRVSILKDKISKLENIVGAYASKDNGLIILIGEEAKEKEKQKAPLTIEDIALALQFSRNKNDDLGVHFSPGETGFLNVVYAGGIQDTHLGYVLYQADRILKEYSLGRRFDGSPVQSSLKSYKSLDNTQHKVETSKHSIYSHLWIKNNPVITSGETSTLLKDLGITVNVESMNVRNGEVRAAIETEIDYSAEKFARFFSNNIVNLAEDEPDLKAFLRIVQILAISKWLIQHDISSKLSWLERYARDSHKTPIRIPVIQIQEERQKTSFEGAKFSSVINVSGGVILGLESEQIQLNNELDSIIRKQLIGKEQLEQLGASIELELNKKSYIGVVLGSEHNKKIQLTI